jgi:hypothetical protein
MSVTESQRRQLHADLERTLGPASAEAMMELLPPVGWGDVAREPHVDAQFVALRGEMAELRAELKGEMAELRAEFKVLEGKVEGQWRRLAALNAVSVLAASVSTAGLVLGAIAIAG